MNEPRGGTDKDEWDLIVVGSGGGALTGAVTAAMRGLRVLVVEKAPVFGGTTALSGGVIWIPGNPVACPEGDPGEARTYLRTLIGNRLRPDVIDAFLRNGPAMVRFLTDHTQAKFAVAGHPDYFTALDGAKEGGRSIMAQEYDLRRLGRWQKLLRRPLKELTLLGSMMIDGEDKHHLLHLSEPKSLFHATRRLLAFTWQRLRYGRGTRLLLGNALIGRLLRSAIDAGVTLRPDTAAVDLVLEGGSVRGLVVRRGGRDAVLRSRGGVLLSAGGFPHDTALCEKLIPFPDQHHSMAPPTNSGDGLRMAMTAGAELGGGNVQNFLGTEITLMRDRHGNIVSKAPFLRQDRPYPGYVLVNKHGLRFVSEAAPYNDVAMALTASPDNVPAFLVTDEDRLRRYGLGLVRPGPAWARPLNGFHRNDYLFSAPTIGELAMELGIDPDGLQRTIDANNSYAESGRDADFHKGDSYYERWQGDQEVGPNPTLGNIGKAPFHAIKLWPGNMGTTCGLLTDTEANVLDGDGKPIGGLYACGTDMHSIFSGFYPGGGGSIGPAMTFGYVAAEAVARRLSDSSQTP